MPCSPMNEWVGETNTVTRPTKTAATLATTKRIGKSNDYDLFFPDISYEARQLRQKKFLQSIIIPLVIEPIVSFVLGLIISSRWLSLTTSESVLLSSLCTVFVAILDLNLRNYLNFEKAEKHHKNFAADVKQLKILSEVQDNLHNIKHPFFNKLAHMKLADFLHSNADFFKGSYHTNPHKIDTFGIEGIKLTQHKINAVSSIADYWDDNFVDEYLKAQGNLIADKGVQIQRIFILNSEKSIVTYKQNWEKQCSFGIAVYYLLSDSVFVPDDWRKQDFLIQDDSLVVEIDTSTHTNSLDNFEFITVDESEVEKKCELFTRMLERAKRFS